MHVSENERYEKHMIKRSNDQDHRDINITKKTKDFFKHNGPLPTLIFLCMEFPYLDKKENPRYFSGRVWYPLLKHFILSESFRKIVCDIFVFFYQSKAGMRNSNFFPGQM